MFDLIATVLAWFYELIPNYAIAIALLTLTVMVLLMPLTLKGTKSMIQMQRLQPEMKRLQAEHRGDRQKLNEEMMKFYQENKINPLGGCLPLLLQLPVFFVLYRVLHKLTETGPDGYFTPSYLDPSTQLYKDLSTSKEMMAFGLDLSHSAAKELSESFVGGLPYLVLILLVTGTSFYQQRQIASRNQGTPVNPQQAMLMKIMPLFFAAISVTLPAGLVVYFLVSNLFRIGQQGYITRKLYHPSMRAQAALDATSREVDGDGSTKVRKELPAKKDPKAPVDEPASKPAPRLRRLARGSTTPATPPPAAPRKPSTSGGRPPRPAGNGATPPPSRVTPKGGGARPTPQGPPRRKKK